jgi:hypothetical protein
MYATSKYYPHKKTLCNTDYEPEFDDWAAALADWPAILPLESVVLALSSLDLSFLRTVFLEFSFMLSGGGPIERL